MQILKSCQQRGGQSFVK